MVENFNIKYLPNSEIISQRWNAAIHQAFNGDIYNLSWYLDGVAPGWGALIEGDYKAVMPVFLHKKFGKTKAYLPGHAGPGGIFSKDPINQNMVDAFMNVLEEHVSDYRVHLNKYMPVGKLSGKQSQNPGYSIDLITSYKKIKSDYSDKAKFNLEYCVENNYSIVYGLSLHEFTSFVRKHQPKLTKADITVYQLIISNAVRYRKGQTIGLYDMVNTLAGVAFILWAKNTVHLQLLVLNKDARKDGTPFLMLDNYFREKAGKNLVFTVNTAGFYADNSILQHMGLRKSNSVILSKKKRLF